MTRTLLAFLLTTCAWSAFAAQESTTTQCVDDAAGNQVCVDTRLYLKEGEVVPPEPEPEPPTFENPAKDAGAHLPITDSVESWGGTPRFIAPNGSGSKCTEAEPCARISDAHNVAAVGDPIIVRGGVYTNHGNTWSGSSWNYEQYITKSVKVVAYPGEIPIFDGSQKITQFTKEGSYKYAAYQDLPCGNGFGITFCSEGTDNLNGTDTTFPYNVGKWPDQAWLDDVQFQQVAKKADLGAGEFWVDAPNNRIYFMASDVDGADTVAVSKLGDWLTCNGDAPGVVIKGLRAIRYSNSRARAAVMDIGPGCDGIQIEHVEMLDTSDMAIFMQGTSTDFLDDATVRHVTIDGGNWMGIDPIWSMHTLLDGLKITNLDRWDEFASSPQSGAVKTSRTWYGKLLNSHIEGNKSQGLWFDQSNYDWIIAGNFVQNNDASCIFWEISDKVKLINNYVNCPKSQPFKLAGSTGVEMWFNTGIGGKDTVGLYADTRSAPTCAANGLLTNGQSCGGFSSDRWTVADPPRPDTMDWLTRLDVMKGNVIGPPSATGYCGGQPTAFCITRINGPANLALNSMLHQAEPGRSIPITESDCNIFSVASGSIIRHSHPTSTAWVGYDNVAAWTQAMAGASPYPELDLDVNSLSGADLITADGTPTDKVDHASMDCPFPTDPVLNEFAPAGTKHYGVLWK